MNATDSRLDVAASSGNEIRFLPNGATAEAITMTTGGNLKFTSGRGIDFSATGDATGATSEILDDYEEGTWTPTCSTMTITSAGDYIKIGRLVYLQGRITRNDASAGSTNIEVAGLPYSLDSTTGASQVSGQFWLDNSNETVDYTGVPYVSSSGPKILFVQSTNPSNQASSRYIQENDITNGRGISFTVVYRAP
jgi:hypothetical protein